MLKNFEPYLKEVDLTLVLKKKKDSEDLVLMVIPRPHHKCKDEELNNIPPFFLVGSLEKIEQDLASAHTQGKIANFHQAVVRSGAFDAVVARTTAKTASKEAAKEPAKKTAAKKAAPKAETPKEHSDLSLIRAEMKTCEKFITAGDQPAVASKWKSIVKLVNLINEKEDVEVSDELAAALQDMRARYKAMPVQTSITDPQ
jgi:hypothetical protein